MNQNWGKYQANQAKHGRWQIFKFVSVLILATAVFIAGIAKFASYCARQNSERQAQDLAKQMAANEAQKQHFAEEKAEWEARHQQSSTTSSESQPQATPSSSSGLTDGFSWRNASDSEKRDLCNRFASASPKGNSANFFYDGLNSMFDTSDSQILQTRLPEAAALLESGSSTLPQNERKY